MSRSPQVKVVLKRQFHYRKSQGLYFKVQGDISIRLKFSPISREMSQTGHFEKRLALLTLP